MWVNKKFNKLWENLILKSLREDFRECLLRFLREMAF